MAHARDVGARAGVAVPERVRLNTDADATGTLGRMPRLDVRDIPPVNRHDRIHEEFEEMESGETLTIVNDHQPKPLYYEMAAEVPAFDEEGYRVRRDAPDEFVAEFPKREA